MVTGAVVMACVMTIVLICTGFVALIVTGAPVGFAIYKAIEVMQKPKTY